MHWTKSIRPGPQADRRPAFPADIPAPPVHDSRHMRYPDPFLAAHGYAAAQRQPLAADASLRTYTRLVGAPRPALRMDAPPPENVRPFAALARHFLAAGLSL